MTTDQLTHRFSIFDYGFRPFFLAAGLYAILPLIPWGLRWAIDLNAALPLQAWHSHEMLFGFAFATIGGFLLTAIPSWTNKTRIYGAPLKLIFGLWLAARVLFWLALLVDQQALRFALFIDLAFPLTLAAYAARSILASGNKRNLLLVAVLLVLSFADALVISNLIGFDMKFDEEGTALTTNVFFILLALIGGRVTANFTRSHFQTQKTNHAVRSLGPVDGLSIASLALMMLVEFIWPADMAVNIIAMIAAALHIVRFSGWQSMKTLSTPILWVLHLGYLWLIVGLALKGLAAFLPIPSNLYIHALAIGAIGTYTMGVMSRAALGHTGRDLKVNSVMTSAFLLVSLAALLRLLLPFVPIFNEMLLASITLWAFAFGLFLLVYIPILTEPRIDGKPG